MIRSLKKLFGWYVDYIYVTYWFIRGFLYRNDGREFLHPHNPSNTPVILIPGVYENWRFMLPIAKALFNAGYPVHILDKLGYNTGKVIEMAQLAGEYITYSNLEHAVIIAHSKGGLIAKLLLTDESVQARISHAICINTPFLGSKYANFFLLPSIRAFTPKHELIKLLAQNREVNSRITSLYSYFDPHIPEGSFLDGAENIELPIEGHFRPVGDPQTLSRIQHILARYKT